MFMSPLLRIKKNKIKKKTQGRGDDCPSPEWNGRLLDPEQLSSHSALHCDLASWWQNVWGSMEEVRKHQEEMEG